MTKNILVLAPFVIVKEFHYPLVALSNILKKQGYEITMVHCKQAMADDCTAMLAKGLGLDGDKNNKTELCTQCARGSFLAAKLYPWRTLWLVEKNPFHTSHIALLGDRELRRMAGYEIVLSRKILHGNSNKETQEAWNTRYNQLREILPQAWQILKTNEFHCIICYNTLYGIHRLFCRLGEKIKVPSLCLHESFHMNDNEEYMMFKANIFEFLKEIQKNSIKTSLPLSRRLQQKITGHIHGLFEGKKPWAYSAPKTSRIISRKARPNRPKILVALSSPDELVGLELLGLLPSIKKSAFRDQISWLRWVFVMGKKFPQAEFFIRPHPRLYPNKRESQPSEFLLQLEKMQNEPRPINVLWPIQEFQGSIWDHMNDTDILLNAWSSVGDVFAYHGIPVFTFFPQYANSGEKLGICGSSAGYYERKLRHFLTKKNRQAVERQAQKWLGAFLDTNTFRLRWKRSKMTDRIQSIIPKKWRQVFDASTISLAHCVGGIEKIKEIVEKNCKT